MREIGMLGKAAGKNEVKGLRRVATGQRGRGE